MKACKKMHPSYWLIGVPPSLFSVHRNFIYSLVAGGAVLGAIALAITAVSNFDPVKRG